MKNKITKLFLVLMLSGFTAYAQTPEERQQIVKDYDLEKLKSLEQQARSEYEKNYEKAVQIARKKGLPIEGVDSEGKKFSLQGIIDGTEDELRYYSSYNNTTTKSSIQTARVQYVHDGTATGGATIEGQGVILGIWDGGAVYAGHQSIGAARVTSKDNNTTVDDHASHVAGTMAANGTISDLKGMAPQALLWSNDYNGDRPEMIAQAAEGLLLSNHSYGTNYVAANYQNNPGVFGKYTNSAKTLDELLFAADNYLPVIAAGNARNGMPSGTTMVYFNAARGGADLMEGEAVSKNAVVVAAVEGVTNYAQPSDVIMSGFSQWGPTDDLRIKPDISAKGVAVKSVGIGSSNDTDVQQGTSMAAPSVTGVFGLWQHYFKTLYPTKIKMRAATVKGLMAISADEAGIADGPDWRFGWGLINARKGAEILRDSKPAIEKSRVIEETLNSGSVYEIQVETNGSTVLKAALSWTDPAGNTVSADDSTVPVLVNDLDLRIIRPNNDVVFPWALDGNFVTLSATKKDNNVDPIEVVEYKGPATGLAGAGIYTIRVSHKGTLTNGSQKFSLIVSGLVGKGVSVKEQQFDNLIVYPNPANDLLTLKADLASISGANTQIFDLTGKQVYQNSDLFYNTNEATLNIDFLDAGVYMLKLSNGEINQTIKIVKK